MSFKGKSDLEQQLLDFVDHIQSLLEADYGDFMREANHDLLHLKDTFKNEGADVQKKIDEMQLYTQFHPSWEVEPTRTRLLNDAEELREMLGFKKGVDQLH